MRSARAGDPARIYREPPGAPRRGGSRRHCGVARLRDGVDAVLGDAEAAGWGIGRVYNAYRRNVRDGLGTDCFWIAGRAA